MRESWWCNDDMQRAIEEYNNGGREREELWDLMFSQLLKFDDNSKSNEKKKGASTHDMLVAFCDWSPIVALIMLALGFIWLKDLSRVCEATFIECVALTCNGVLQLVRL